MAIIFKIAPERVELQYDPSTDAAWEILKAEAMADKLNYTYVADLQHAFKYHWKGDAPKTGANFPFGEFLHLFEIAGDWEINSCFLVAYAIETWGCAQTHYPKDFIHPILEKIGYNGVYSIEDVFSDDETGEREITSFFWENGVCTIF